MDIQTVAIEKPPYVNVILGQAHFIKTVDDLHDTIVQAAPAPRFGVAFCESSGPRLVRRSGNDEAMVELAVRNLREIGAGHAFLVCLQNLFPINVLNAIKGLPEVCRVFCATANDVQVLVAPTALGRGILGVVDGGAPLGVESEADARHRAVLLRELGYRR